MALCATGEMVGTSAALSREVMQPLSFPHVTKLYGKGHAKAERLR
jgi:hypothetical protein